MQPVTNGLTVIQLCESHVMQHNNSTPDKIYCKSSIQETIYLPHRSKASSRLGVADTHIPTYTKTHISTKRTRTAAHSPIHPTKIPESAKVCQKFLQNHANMYEAGTLLHLLVAGIIALLLLAFNQRHANPSRNVSFRLPVRIQP